MGTMEPLEFMPTRSFLPEPRNEIEAPLLHGRSEKAVNYLSGTLRY